MPFKKGDLNQKFKEILLEYDNFFSTFLDELQSVISNNNE